MATTNSSSTLALRDYLRLIIASPNEYHENDALLKSLASQNGTCKLSIEYTHGEELKKIAPMSLNTQKKCCEDLLPRGFETLNKLRIDAYTSLLNCRSIKTEKPNRRTREGLKKVVSNLDDELMKHKQINFILLQAISTAMSGIRSVRDAKQKDTRDKRAEDALSNLRAIISLNPSSWDHVNDISKVVDLDDYRSE